MSRFAQSEHPEELLAFYVNGSLGGEELRYVVDHLKSCTECRHEVEILEALRRDIQEAGQQSPRSAEARTRRAEGLSRLTDALDDLESLDDVRMSEVENAEPSDIEVVFIPRPANAPSAGLRAPAWLPLAAAALLALTVGSLYLFRGSAIEEPVIDRAGSDPVEASIRSELANGSVLPLDAFDLRWRVPEEWARARYVVNLTTANLEPVYSANDLEDTALRVPAAALVELPPSTRLLWRVEALLPNGHRIRSQTFVVELEPRRDVES